MDVLSNALRENENDEERYSEFPYWGGISSCNACKQPSHEDDPCGIAADAVPLKQPPTRMLNVQQCRLRGKSAESSHPDLFRMKESIRYRVISVLLEVLGIMVSE